jgi:hypothetical protein
MRHRILTLVVCVMLAGCGGTDSTGDPSGEGSAGSARGAGSAGDASAGRSPTPAGTFTATGFLTAEGTFGVACSGVGRSSGLRPGAPVLVRDPGGTVVATGALEDGFADDDAPQRRCIFPFTVRGIPDGDGRFTVRVAGRPAGGFDRRHAAQVGLHIG